MLSPHEDPCKAFLSLASPAVHAASLPVFAVTRPCLAGIGVSVLPSFPRPIAQESGGYLSLFPRATSRHWDSQQGPPLQGISSWGSGDPHVPTSQHTPAPLQLQMCTQWGI